MSNKGKFAAILLAALLMAAPLSACSDGGASSGSAPAAEQPSASTSEPADSGAAEEQPVEDVTDDAIHPMRYVTPGNMPPDAETGLAAVNEKLQADGVNIEVQPIRIPWDAYDQKLNLMLSSGEEFELIHVMQDVKNISSLASRNALQPMTPYLDKYPGLVDKFSEMDWKAGLYNGEIYAVPMRFRARKLGYLTVRTDTMNKFTDTFPGDDVDEMLDLFEKMQADITEEVGKKAYHWPHQLSIPPFWLHRTYDTFPFYVENSLGVVLVRQDGTIDSYYESEEFKQDAETYKRMYDAGLIHPDILNAPHEQKNDEYKIGAFLPSETFGFDGFVSLQENIPTADVDVIFTAEDTPHLIYTFSQNLNGISTTAEDPESGIKFLNWIYEDKANHDLFHYGVEGVHYTASAPNRIQTIKDESNANLYGFDTWMSGYLPYLRYDEAMPDKAIDWDNFEAEDKVYSPVAGFLFDASNVEAELASIQTEIIASIYPIKFGLQDYETAFPAALERLKAAGLDKYLEEYRTQFAAYLEANPDAVAK